MAEASSGGAATPRSTITDNGTGRRALERLREDTYDLVEVLPSVASDEFMNIAWGTHLTSGLLVDTRFSAARFDRTPRHVARSGLDHYQVSMFLEGETEFTAGRRVASMRPGDIVLIDVAQANRTDMAAGASGVVHAMSLILPRPLLAPLLGAPDTVSASLISRDSQVGRLVGERLLSLRRDGARLGIAEAAAAVDGVAGLVAEAVGPAAQAELAVTRASRSALLAAIKSHIEKSLMSEEAVAATALCRRFGLSRATLYRLFQPDGGLSHYIQERHLHRAFMRLISPAERRWRIIDLAVDHRFSSDNTFIRAFRRRFGLTPGEAHDVAVRGSAERRGFTANGFTSDADALAWMAGLTTN
jgi:AraC-like DNA-binding protein